MSASFHTPIEEPQKNIEPHTPTAKIMHWGFIAVFIYGITKQVDEVEELEDFTLLQEEIAFAVLFLLLLLARFVYMQSSRPTVIPSSTPRSLRLLARIVHLGMYASLALIAVTGLMIGGLYWSGVKTGQLMDALLLGHEVVFWVSINLIALHVIGAIYHRQKDDGIWRSMLPRRESDVTD